MKMFKVGDVIKGVCNTRYSITNDRMLKAKVVKAFGNEMDIRILEHLDEENIGKIYPVVNDSKFFAIHTDSFKKGDFVKINKDATINDLTKNYWEGCQLSTIEFLKEYYDKNAIFEVTEVDRGVVSLKETTRLVNINILEMAERPLKEMTIAEIEKELGYKIKIIKDEQ